MALKLTGYEQKDIFQVIQLLRGFYVCKKQGARSTSRWSPEVLPSCWFTFYQLFQVVRGRDADGIAFPVSNKPFDGGGEHFQPLKLHADVIIENPVQQQNLFLLLYGVGQAATVLYFSLELIAARLGMYHTLILTTFSVPVIKLTSFLRPSGYSLMTHPSGVFFSA